MSKDFKEQFVGVLWDAELDPTGYTGRGMYGSSECVAVMCDTVAECCGKLMEEIADQIEYASDDEQRAAALRFLRDAAIQIAKFTHTDAHGRDGVVVYWKNISATLLVSDDEDTKKVQTHDEDDDGDAD